ncbi:MAG: glycosyltransferase family 2 protein [Candidatus Eremiobacteraeota bacterium]|nr:glycosyltransferase family 2 protein [Candidatus Eremiobacteraeota bacterium]MCW5868803.1 glycosyltransferase family 2 protein [Candidatus Eremiobacteraeota bacterium]
MDFSVIVATFNRRELALRLVDALAGQSLAQECFEVVVVDDGSEDGTAEALEALGHTWLRVVRQANRGPAAARNLALRHARGNWIAMTDDDTLPRPDWLEQLHQAIQQNPGWIGVEGRTFCPDPDPLGHWVENLRGGQYITANMAYRREVLEAVEGLDESFPHPKCEDTELAWRCLQHGTIGFWPAMEISHPNRPQPLSSWLRGARYELSEFRLHRKLGNDYGKFRRFSRPWPMLGLIYLIVPLFRAWRFRRQLMGPKGLSYCLVHLLRPGFFLYYWATTVAQGET